jgi:large subunit ribosomal protein L4
MTVKVISTTGAKQAGSVKLPESPKLSEASLSRVIRATLANESRERPLVKTRSHVRGGGTKPWRQKGTGRARAGTIRSPLWRGGGITFGPSGEPRTRQDIPKKIRLAAFQLMLNRLAKDDRLTVLAGKPSLAKTKDAARLFAKLESKGSTLFVVAAAEFEGAIGSRNLDSVELTTAADLSVADLARHAQVVFTKAALDGLLEPPKPEKKPAAKPKAKTTPKGKAS